MSRTQKTILTKSIYIYNNTCIREIKCRIFTKVYHLFFFFFDELKKKNCKETYSIFKMKHTIHPILLRLEMKRCPLPWQHAIVPWIRDRVVVGKYPVRLLRHAGRYATWHGVHWLQRYRHGWWFGRDQQSFIILIFMDIVWISLITYSNGQKQSKQQQQQPRKDYESRLLSWPTFV